VAAILALAPLALGWAQGLQCSQPLAIAIISGLVLQLPLRAAGVAGAAVVCSPAPAPWRSINEASCSFSVAQECGL